MKVLCSLGFLLLTACSSQEKDRSQDLSEIEITKTPMATRFYDRTPQGDTISCYTLTNSNGLSMEVITFGGIITSLKTPDRSGNFDDIVLGFDSLGPYLHDSPYFGALIGRYGNRIANGKFNLEGNEFNLVQNNMGNHLHGGTIGFDKVIWKAQQVESNHGQALELSYTSPDGEEGYPGELQVKVTYTLREDDALEIKYYAITSKPTVVNLTQHSYFNLNPQASTILDHQLTLFAHEYLPVNETLIPLGQPSPVTGTPFDFREPRVIGDRIDEDHLQLKRGGGYDHCWVLTDSSSTLKEAAELYDPHSGRVVTVSTTEPGIQFYSGNFLDGSLRGKSGRHYQKRSGLCLETQHFPDSPNQPHFPSTRLDPGEAYQSTTVFAFETR